MRKALLFLLILGTTWLGAETALPFWAEKISYIEDGNLYVIGVSTHQPSIEVARAQALENGRWELARAANVKGLDLTGLIIQTSRNFEFEEKNHSGFTAYRLLHVSVEELRRMKNK